MRAMSARGFNGYGPAVQAGQRDAGSSLRKAQMKNRIHEKEQLLNAAITNADISRSFEEYLEIFDAFYAEDITVSSDQQEEPTRGKANVRGLVFNFLVPLHVMAEVGGSKVTVHATPIPGDTLNKTHSVLTLDLTGQFGAKCTLTWSLLRRWRGSRVVYERHYAHHQTNRPLTFEDLRFAGLEASRLRSRQLWLSSDASPDGIPPNALGAPP